MPIFYYKAKKRPGEIVEGHFEAQNFDQAVNKVIQMGCAPVDVRLDDAKGPVPINRKNPAYLFNFYNRVRLPELARFTRQLSDLIDAGIPLVRGLQVAADQAPNSFFRDIIQQLHDFVEDGGAFSEALKQHPRIFFKLYLHMVNAGEVSGQLNIILSRLADFIEREQETRSKVQSSLVYPALMLSVGAVTIFILLSFVIPKLTVMFDDVAETLPLPTVILLSLSDFFARYWWLLVALITLIGAAFRKYLDFSEGRLWFDGAKLKVPIFGSFIRDMEVGRFARTLGTLLESGVVIVAALDATLGILDNAVLKREIEEVSLKVSGGLSLTAALSTCRFFPDIAINMMSVGEESGNLENSLYKLADSYDKQSDRLVKRFTSLLEPMLIILIGSVVGFIVMAMLLPIFKMNLIIQ